MATPQVSGLQAFSERKRKLRHEYREKESALRAELRAREDQLLQELDDKLAEVDRDWTLSLLNAQPCTGQYPSSNQATACGHTLEAVTSSSPVDTIRLQWTEPTQLEPQAAYSNHDAALETDAQTKLAAQSSSQLDVEHNSSSGRAGNNSTVASAHQVQATATADPERALQQPDTANGPATSTSQLPATVAQADASVTAIAHPPPSPHNTSSAESHETISIDLSHVVPVEAQRDPGTTTYMMCRPARRAGKRKRQWPSCLWKNFGEEGEPAQAREVGPSACVPELGQARKPSRLYTNDAALTDQDELADCVNQKEITPALWSYLLSHELPHFRFPIIKSVKRTLYQGLREIRKRREEVARADSDEDDGDQFAVQAGLAVASLPEHTADADSDEEAVLPLYGDSESDYDESSFEEPAQDSTTGEVVLAEVDAAADQPRLEDAYSIILQQAGLSGDELQTALTAWMAYMAKEVSQVADRLAERLGRIRGSRAAELIIEERLATAVNMVAGVLGGMHRDWELKQLPKLQLDAYAIWQSRLTSRAQAWPGDALYQQELLLKLVHQVTLMQTEKAYPAFKAVKKSCSSISETFRNLQEVLFKLKVAQLADAPAKPTRNKAKSATRQGTAVSDSKALQEGQHQDHEDDNDAASNCASGSWLVEEDEEPLGQQDDLQPGEEVSSQDPKQPAKRAWQGRTEVLVGPGSKAALLRQQQQGANPDSDPASHPVHADSPHKVESGSNLQLNGKGTDEPVSGQVGSQPEAKQLADYSNAQDASDQQQTLAAANDRPEESFAGDFDQGDADDFDDADSYQGLPDTTPAAVSPVQKQSGYSLSDDDLPDISFASAREGANDEGTNDEANGADSRRDGPEQQAPAAEVDLPDGLQSMLDAPQQQQEHTDASIEQSTKTAELDSQPQLQQQKDAERPPEQLTNPELSSESQLPQQTLTNPVSDATPAPQAADTAPDVDVPMHLSQPEMVTSAPDMDVDIEATDDLSAGSRVELRHEKGSSWSWQTAKLCGSITPLSESTQVSYRTALGSVTKTVSVQQVRPALPASTQIFGFHLLQKGSIVEANLGHDKHTCAVVMSQPRLTPLKYKLSTKRLKGSTRRTQLSYIEAASSAVLLDSLGSPDLAQCCLYVPEKRGVHVVPHSGQHSRLRWPMQLDDDKCCVPLASSAIAALREACGYSDTVISLGHMTKRRDAAVRKVCEDMQSKAIPDGLVRRSFIHRYLARQPFLRFPKTKKLLDMARLRKTLKPHIIGSDVVGTSPPRQSGGTDAQPNRRGSHKPVKHVVAATDPGASQQEKLIQRQEKRQEMGRKEQTEKAQAQLDKIKKKQQQKEERRKSLAGTVPPPRIALASLADPQAMPLSEDQPEVVVAGCIASRLKDHQKAGIRFLWRNVVLEHEDKDEDAGGCILAHDMGLGKSLQVVAVLHTYHTYYPDKRSVLVVPPNVVHNWLDEFNAWLPDQASANMSELSRDKVCIYKAPEDVQTWQDRSGAVLIISYQTLAIMHKATIAPAPKAASDAKVAAFQTLCKQADIVVADEGHQIKNPKTRISVAMNSFHTMRRMALTGYPLQNNMDEYYTMVQWCKNDILDHSQYFHQTWAAPIAAGQQLGASAEQIAHMNQQLSILQAITSNFVHRVGRDQLIRDLPIKREHVVLLRLTEAQETMYQAYLEVVEQYGHDVLVDKSFLHVLCQRPIDAVAKLRAWAHGDAVDLPQGDKDEQLSVQGMTDLSKPAHPAVAGLRKEGSPTSSDNESSDALAAAASGEVTGAEEPRSSDFKCKKKFAPEAAKTLLAVADKLAADGKPLDGSGNGKRWAVMHILKACMKRKEKLVIYSQYLDDLDELELSLQKELGWTKSIHYLRLDGKINAQKRQQNNKVFQNPNSSAQVYLVSTKAGSVGINLTAACRMIILDELWNPVHNAQAIARIFRYGQKQETFVYRLLYKGSIEQRVYRRSVDKEGLFQRVVDERTIKGTNKQEDVDLYTFEASKPADTGFLNGVAVNSTDEVLKSLLRVDMQGDSWIAGWENHTENLPEDPTQRMTKEQRRVAAKRYAEEEERVGTEAVKKRRRLMKRVYGDDDDPDFVLSKADAKKIEVAQAAELQDPDPVSAARPAVGVIEDKQLPGKQQTTLSGPSSNKAEEHTTNAANASDPVQAPRTESHAAAAVKKPNGGSTDGAQATAGTSGGQASTARPQQQDSVPSRSAGSAAKPGSSAKHSDLSSQSKSKAGLHGTASSPAAKDRTSVAKAAQPDAEVAPACTAKQALKDDSKPPSSPTANSTIKATGRDKARQSSQPGSPLLAMLQTVKNSVLAKFASGASEQEAPRSPLLPVEPTCAKKNNMPESAAALFVAQSPSDNRKQAKTDWIAHRVKALGHTVEEAEAAWRQARKEALRSPHLKAPKPSAEPAVAEPASITAHTPAVAAAPTKVINQPKGLPALTPKKAKHQQKARRADKTAKPARAASTEPSAADTDAATEGSGAVAKPSKAQRKEMRRALRAARQSQSSSVEPTASNVAHIVVRSLNQAQHSGSVDAEAPGTDARSKDREQSVSSESPPLNARHGPAMHGSHAAVVRQSLTQAQQSGTMDSDTEAGANVQTDRQRSKSVESAAPMHIRPGTVVQLKHTAAAAAAAEPRTTQATNGTKTGPPRASVTSKDAVQSVVQQQAHTWREKQSPSPRKQSLQSPSSALASPSVPDLFARHASDQLRTKGAQLEARLAAAVDDKPAQQQTSAKLISAKGVKHDQKEKQAAETPVVAGLRSGQSGMMKSTGTAVTADKTDKRGAVANTAVASGVSSGYRPGTHQRASSTAPPSVTVKAGSESKAVGSASAKPVPILSNVKSGQQPESSCKVSSSAPLTKVSHAQPPSQAPKPRHMSRADSDACTIRNSNCDIAKHAACKDTSGSEVNSAAGTPSTVAAAACVDLATDNVDSNAVPAQHLGQKRPTPVHVNASVTNKRARSRLAPARKSLAEVVDLTQD